MKIRSLLLLIVVSLLSCNQNNVKTDASIEAVFSKYNVKGSFALLENGTGDFIIQDLNFYKDSAQSPLQTFFIIPQLMGYNNGFTTHNQSIELDSIEQNIQI